MTSIGSLIASFQGDTTNFDAAVRRVETRMKALQASVASDLRSVKQQFAGLSVGQSFEATAKKIDATIKSNGNSFKNLALNANASQQKIGSGELSLSQQLGAVASLQRQRSSALVGQFKLQERAALQAAAGVRPFREVIQSLSTSIATLQGPLGGVSGRLSSIASLAGGLTASTGGLAIALGAAVAATAGAAFGIYRLATASQELGGRIFDLSTKVNFSAETLSSLKVAAELSGGSLESLSTSLGIFNRNMEDAKDESSELGQIFKVLKIDTNDNEKALRQAFAALSLMKNGSQQTALAMKLFGRSGKDVLGILKETGGNIDGFVDKMREMGLVLTSSGAKKADEFGDRLTLLQNKIAAIGRQIGTELVPVVSKAADDISQWLKENQGEIAKTAKELGSLISGFYELAKVVSSPFVAQVIITRKFIDALPEAAAGAARGAEGAPTHAGVIPKARLGPSANAPRELAKDLPTLAPFLKPADPHFKFIDPVAREQQALQKALDAIQNKAKRGGGGGGGGGKGESAAERVAKQAFDLAKIQLQGAESIYRDALDKEQSYYDQSLTSLGTYTQKRIELEDERYEKEKDTFKKEQQLISSGSFKPGERDVKQADLNQNIEDAERKHFSTVRAIRADDKREQLDADKRHGEAVISLHEASLRSLEANLLRSVSVRRKTAVEAEETMFAAMQQVLSEKGDRLQKELTRVLIDPNQAREVQDQIDALNLEIQQSVKDHVHKLDDARQEDVQSAISYSQQLRSIANEIIGTELDTARIRVQAIKDNTLYRTQAIQEEARIEKAAEQARTADQIKGLRERQEIIRAEADALKSDPFEALKQLKAIDQQIASIERNAAARQIEIQRQAQEQILEKWREVATDITDILSAGITGGFKGALGEVTSLLNQISREILNSAVMKILQPNAPNQGSQAGGIIGGISNKLLDLIGLGRAKEKPIPAGITLARGDETRPRIVGELDTLTATVSTVGDRITVSQTHAADELNRARTEQTQQLVTTLNGIAEHICQCSQPAKESFTEGLLRSVIPATISAIPTRQPTPPSLPAPRSNVTSVVRDIPEAGSGILVGGDTGGGTRPRIAAPQVTPQTVSDASRSISGSVVDQTREQEASSTNHVQDLKNRIAATGQEIIAGLAPARQGFWSGLAQAAIGGAVSGLASGLMGGIGRGGRNEGGNSRAPNAPTGTSGGWGTEPGRPVLRQYRALGGPVSSRETYIVGEKGEELFTPRKDGYIIPHSEISNVKNINNRIINNQSNKTVSNQQKDYIKNFVTTVKNEMGRVAGRGRPAVELPVRGGSQISSTQNSVSSVINNLIQSPRRESVEKAIQLLETRVPELRILRTDKTLKETSADRFLKETFRPGHGERFLSNTPRTEGRALGGPVSSGKTYAVGEKGKELFTPDKNALSIKETDTRKESLIQQFANTIKPQVERVIGVSSVTNQRLVNNGPRNTTENTRNLAVGGNVFRQQNNYVRNVVNKTEGAIRRVLPQFKIALRRSVNKESSVEKVLKETVNSLQTNRLQPINLTRVEGRASGGPVSAGKTYMVGEQGREVFTEKTKDKTVKETKDRKDTLIQQFVNTIKDQFERVIERPSKTLDKESPRENVSGAVKNETANITNRSSSVVNNGPRNATENTRNFMARGGVFHQQNTYAQNVVNRAGDVTGPTTNLTTIVGKQSEPRDVVKTISPQLTHIKGPQSTIKTVSNNLQAITNYAPPINAQNVTNYASKEIVGPERLIQQVLPQISPKMPVKQLALVIRSLVPVEQKMIDARVPELKVMLAPSINKESSVEKILKESMKTDRLLPRAEGRAMGGPVRVGLPYDVHKDEMIVPMQPGQVFNQSQMSNSRGDVINKYYNIQLPPSPKGSYQSPKSKRELAESLIAALQSQS